MAKDWTGLYIKYSAYRRQKAKARKINALLHSKVYCSAKNASLTSESFVAVAEHAVARCLSRFLRAFVFEVGDDRGEAS